MENRKKKEKDRKPSQALALAPWEVGGGRKLNTQS
jgi:hypothetical protein